MTTTFEYVDISGRNRYRKWFSALSNVAAVKVAIAIYRMTSGNTAGLKSLGHGLAEWRIDWGPGLRIYVHQDGASLIVLLGGSDKSQQNEEILRARAMLKEYKHRKKAGVIACTNATQGDKTWL